MTDKPNLAGDRGRNIRIGVLVGIPMALLTFVLLVALGGVAYFFLLAGLLIINPTGIMFLLLGVLALLQVGLGALVGYRTTGEKHTLRRNLRRAFLTVTVLMVILSPLYICPMYFYLGDAGTP